MNRFLAHLGDRAWLVLLGLLCTTSAPFLTQGQEASAMHHHATEAGSARETAVGKMTIPDLEVLDQNGKRLHFYRDLVRQKVVAINFIFTTCTTICPPMAATFARVQALMGETIGEDARLISISVDPVTDTPERLRAWSAKFGARPGWTLVTGDKTKIDELLFDLGGFTADKQSHSPIVLVGNDNTSVWTRIYGLAPAARIASLIEEMMQAPPAGETVRKGGRP